jgi:hypothetical protein
MKARASGAKPTQGGMSRADFLKGMGVTALAGAAAVAGQGMGANALAAAAPVAGSEVGTTIVGVNNPAETIHRPILPFGELTWQYKQLT